VFDLTQDDDARERVAAEAFSEHRRLFYVALTRPIFKLYVPKVKIPARAGGWLGPVGTILLPALEQSCPDKLGPLIAEVVKPPFSLAVEHSTPDVVSAVLESSPISPPSPLLPKIDATLARRRIVVRSFSSMAKHHLSLVGEGSSFGEQTPIAADEMATQPDQDDPLRGPVFGDMVHKVLEHIDFAEVARAASPDELYQVGTHARKHIDQEIQSNLANLRARTPIEQLADACRQQIASLIWHTLKTPLAEVGGPLCAIAPTDRLHEIDFLFPDRPGEIVPADTSWEDGFVTGFMDLLFRRRDRYFLLDWKTNLLPAYTREQIERSMADSDYHRQYRLYLHAARRWLERIQGPKFRFFERFAGVYYLYVRGMNGRDETAGVYFHRPTETELDLHSILNS
jgi:ATP-dependent exoDNAse (exonuclease V) beta subunit